MNRLERYIQLATSAPDLLAACEFALKEFKPEECHCEETSEGSWPCYFHRIEWKLRQAVEKAKVIHE